MFTTHRRLPVLIKRFKTHLSNIEKRARCLSWIHQLTECLHDWMSRVKELSRSTQQLDVDSPSQEALVVLLKENEGNTRGGKIRSKVEEEAIQKARNWTGRYSALQQSKKLALNDWFRLSLGRRRLVSVGSAKTCVNLYFQFCHY